MFTQNHAHILFSSSAEIGCACISQGLSICSSAHRAEQLKQLGFELDDESAEWLRSFNDVKAYQGRMGHSCPGPLTSGASFLLTNWSGLSSRYINVEEVNCEHADIVNAIAIWLFALPAPRWCPPTGQCTHCSHLSYCCYDLLTSGTRIDT